MNKILLLFVFLPILLYSQNGDNAVIEHKRNSVYLEFLGNSAYTFSINYERILTDSFNEYEKMPRKNHIAVRIGFGFLPNNYDDHVFTLPLELLSVFGNQGLHFEIGMGATLYYGIFYNQNRYRDKQWGSESSVVIFSRIGFRYTGEKGLIFRLGYTPVLYEGPYALLFDHPFQLFGGASIGYSF
ncbi:MAG: hypothetical protein GXO89_02045 [Chlorobi bacterium]|nr:hypothetical protein [Chlorobiota bacterium]